MKSICIQIGNSDHKFTQHEWSEFCRKTYNICVAAGDIQFAGSSPANALWQNYCICVNSADPELILAMMTRLKVQYRQESIAWLEGTTCLY